MKNEKRFLTIFLSFALVLFSLFPVQQTFVSAEASQIQTDTTALKDSFKVPQKSSGCSPKVITQVTCIKVTETTETTVTKISVSDETKTATGVTPKITSLTSEVSSTTSKTTTFTLPCIINGSHWHWETNPAPIIDKDLYIDNVKVKPGETAVVSINFGNNEEDYLGIRLHVYLLDGISVEKVEDGSGNEIEYYSGSDYIDFAIKEPIINITYKAEDNIANGTYDISYSAFKVNGTIHIYGGDVIVDDGAEQTAPALTTKAFETPAVTTAAITNISTTFTKPIIDGVLVPVSDISLTAKLDDVTVDAGETTVVKLALEKNNNKANVLLSLPDGITCEGITDSNGKAVDFEIDDRNIKFTIIKTTEAEITLAVDEAAVSGVYEINCSIEGEVYGNVKYAEYDTYILRWYESYLDVFSITGGNITVEVNIPSGDANDDGELNIRDAAFIARMLAERKAGELPESADFNGDGVVNIRDAASIARFLASEN